MKRRTDYGWNVADSPSEFSNEVEIIASRFHAALAFGHGVALWFNLRRKNWRDAAIHAAFVVYDVSSAISHHRSADEN